MWKAKYVRIEAFSKCSSGNGSKDVAVLQNHMSHTAPMENDTSYVVPNFH